MKDGFEAYGEMDEAWLEDLPDEIVCEDKETAVGQNIVFEWHVRDGKRVPGAWVTIGAVEITEHNLKDRQGRKRDVKRYRASDFKVSGDEILSPDEKLAFLKKDYPRLAFKGPIPTPVTIRIHRDYDVTIQGLKRHKVPGTRDQFEWKPTEVRVQDFRPDKMVRRVPPNPRFSKNNEDVVRGLTHDQLKAASVESSYTRNPKQAVDSQLSAVPDDWEDMGAVARDKRRKSSQVEVQHEREVQAAKSRLNRLIRNAKNPQEAEWILGQVVKLCEQAELKDAA